MTHCTNSFHVLAWRQWCVPVEAESGWGKAAVLLCSFAVFLHTEEPHRDVMMWRSDIFSVCCQSGISVDLKLISNIQPVASLQVSASQLCLHFELILIFLSTLSLQNSACVYQVVLFHWEEPESVHVDWRDKYVLIQEKTFKIADTKWPAETDSNGKAWWIWSHSDCGWWAPTVHILWVFVAVWSFNAICRAEGSSVLRCLCPHRKPWTTASGHP